MFDPLEHKGMPLQDQLRNWRELNVEPIDPEAVDPFPRLRQHVPADRLRALATAVRAAEATAPTRRRPSAQTAKGNLAAGPALVVIHRVRDAIRKPSES